MHKRESTIKLLFMMIREQAKRKKELKRIKLKLKGEKPKRNELEYTLSEYKLTAVRNDMYDLERMKFATCTALDLNVVNSINEKLIQLKKEENKIIKYRLQA